jgi:hypothetical protein
MQSLSSRERQAMLHPLGRRLSVECIQPVSPKIDFYVLKFDELLFAHAKLLIFSHITGEFLQNLVKNNN